MDRNAKMSDQMQVNIIIENSRRAWNIIKNSPQTSAVVTCSLYVAADLLLRDIIVLKLPVRAVRSLLNKNENTTKQSNKMIKKRLPIPMGKLNKEPSTPFEMNEQEFSKEESLNRIPLFFVDKYSYCPKFHLSESDLKDVSSDLKQTEIESFIVSGNKLGTVLLSFRQIYNSLM